MRMTLFFKGQAGTFYDFFSQGHIGTNFKTGIKLFSSFWLQIYKFLLIKIKILYNYLD